MSITNTPSRCRFIKNAMRFVVLFIAGALAVISVGSSSRAALKPLSLTTTIPMLPGTTLPIKVAQGDQTNPSVSCELAAYTNDDFTGVSTINYFDFASHTEHVLPGNGLDRLAATDGKRIALPSLKLMETTYSSTTLSRNHSLVCPVNTTCLHQWAETLLHL